MSAETTRQLLRHAGIGDEGAGVPAIARCTHGAAAGPEQLEAAVADFLRSLSRLNAELNGGVPSRGDVRVPDVPREIAYAVAEVTRLLRARSEAGGDDPRVAAAARGARQIETAWSAVLAGDVDDLHERLAP